MGLSENEKFEFVIIFAKFYLQNKVKFYCKKNELYNQCNGKLYVFYTCTPWNISMEKVKKKTHSVDPEFLENFLYRMDNYLSSRLRKQWLTKGLARQSWPHTTFHSYYFFLISWEKFHFHWDLCCIKFQKTWPVLWYIV